jgi:hypothetical protein
VLCRTGPVITDAAINIYPTLEDKVDIVQNPIDLAHVLSFDQARVAILSAVETVYPKIASTLEAAALCKMADRGQITGGVLDGPLAFDNAINEEAARTKQIVSPVAGKANILVVPDLESGNMLAKQLHGSGRCCRDCARRTCTDRPHLARRQRAHADGVLRCGSARGACASTGDSAGNCRAWGSGRPRTKSGHDN